MTERAQFIEQYPNLAAAAHGAAICTVSDEFFAPAKRMLAADEPVFIAQRFDQHGKWMDGWESRRRRAAGHDFCIVRICAGVIHGVEIDTRHFTGNFPPAASLEACRVAVEPNEQTVWTELVPKADLAGDSRQFFAVAHSGHWTHVRLNIYPDGGIARLRIYGEPDAALDLATAENWTDLSSTVVGGQALLCNDMHFGHMRNLLSPKPVANMGDGWETRRRRQPGNDWVILKLGRVGRVCRVELDTAFFRGNYPACCSLKAAAATTGDDLASSSQHWLELLPAVALGPDQLHLFQRQLQDLGPVSHVRMDIYPDGGVARLRLLGVPAALQTTA